MDIAARREILTFASIMKITATVIMMASLRESTMFEMLVSMIFCWVSAISKAMSGNFFLMAGRAFSTAFMVVVTWPFSGRRRLIPMAAWPFPR